MCSIPGVAGAGRSFLCSHPCSVPVAVTLPATIMTSSVPTTVGGHMMYPSPHAVMYAPTSGLADGGLAVLNAFPQAPSAMQVSHGQVQEQGKDQLSLRGLFSLIPRVFMPYINRRGFSSQRSWWLRQGLAREMLHVCFWVLPFSCAKGCVGC